MAKTEEHPLYIGEIAGLPTFWDCDDLDIDGLHLRQVRKDDEYDFYNSEDYHYMISLVPSINRWQITDEIHTEVTTYKKDELDKAIYHTINIFNADKAHEDDDEDDTPDSDNEDDMINFMDYSDYCIYSAFNHLNKIYAMEKKYGLKESNKHTI